MRILKAAVLVLVWAQIGVLADPIDSGDFSAIFPAESADHNGITYRTAYACQGQTLNISCPRSGDVIKVIRANYGRFSIAICNEEGRTDFSVNCLAPNSFGVMQERCNFRSNCVGDASLFLDGADPCPSTPKYLEVHYGCIPVSTTTTTTERPLPPWMRTTSTTTTPPTSQSREESKRRRVPITLPPTRPQTSPDRGQTMRINEKVKTKNILNKFLSSSISSTNIMDTSETPVTFLDKENAVRDGQSTLVTLEPTSTSTSTTTPSTTTTTTESTTAPSPHFQFHPEQSNKDVVLPNHIPYGHTMFPHLATESPRPNPKASLVNERSFIGNPLQEYPGYCSPRRVRTLDWSWTRPATVAVMPCPLSTSGLARWHCGQSGQYLTPHPDLSQCQSIWLKKIQTRLVQEQLSIVHVARDILYYLGSHPLFGGDLKILGGALDLMTSELRSELSDIPTREQRKAVVTEYVQSVVHVTSHVLEDKNVISGAWSDLPTRQARLDVFATFMTVLEDSGLLLLEGAVHDDQETSVQGRNVLISVRNVSFRQMLPLSLPSEAALAAQDWEGRSESIVAPSVVLMENMERGGGTNVAFVMTKNGHLIVADDQFHGDPNTTTAAREEGEVQRQPLSGDAENLPALEAVPKNMISYVLSVALGRPNAKHHQHFLPKTSQPMTITFQHLVANVSSPRCVFWHSQLRDWSSRGCQLLQTNHSHSICSCDHLSSFALVDDLDHDPSSTWNPWVWISAILIVSLVAVGLMLLIAFIIFHCKRRRGWQKPLKDESQEAKASSCCCLGSQPSGSSTSDSFHDHDMLESPTFHQNPRLRDPSSGSNLDRGMHLTLRPMISSPMVNSNPPPDLVRLQHFNTQPFPGNHHPSSQTHQTQQSGGGHQPTLWHHQTARPSTHRPHQAGSRNKWHGPGVNGKVVETPERPLLTDFPSPGQFSNTNHIYMEVQDPWHQGHYEMDPNYVDPGLTSPTPLSHQPIHLPIMVAESSNSSQSSGYGSATFHNQQLQLQQQQLMNQARGDESSQVFAISSRGPPSSSGRSMTMSRHRPSTLFKGQPRPKYHYPGREDGLRSPGSLSQGGPRTVEHTQLI